MVLHFSKYLNTSNIQTISEKFGFSNPSYIEKFIMDFEMGFHILNKMNCIIRGGMCMPFHTNLDVRRLSIDIDLLTPKTVSETEIIMETLNSELPDLTITKKVPKRPYPNPHILSFDVSYSSYREVDDFIKVDFLCNFDINLPHQTLSKQFDVLDFTIDFPVTILNHGSLIGDKLTTLALEKIGLPEWKFGDIPKQIYDISTLIKLSSRDDIRDALEVFQKLTPHKISTYEKTPPFTISEIITSILECLNNCIDYSATLTISHDANDRYSNFKGRYLARSGQEYGKTRHIFDILIVLNFVKHLEKYLENTSLLETNVENILKILESISKLQKLEFDERRMQKEDLLNAIPSDLPFNKKILNGSSIEQIFLIKEIFSN